MMKLSGLILRRSPAPVDRPYYVSFSVIMPRIHISGSCESEMIDMTQPRHKRDRSLQFGTYGTVLDLQISSYLEIKAKSGNCKMNLKYTKMQELGCVPNQSANAWSKERNWIEAFNSQQPVSKKKKR